MIKNFFSNKKLKFLSYNKQSGVLGKQNSVSRSFSNVIAMLFAALIMGTSLAGLATLFTAEQVSADVCQTNNGIMTSQTSPYNGTCIGEGRGGTDLRYFQFVVTFSQDVANATVTYQNAEGNTGTGNGSKTFSKINNRTYASLPDKRGLGYQASYTVSQPCSSTRQNLININVSANGRTQKFDNIDLCAYILSSSYIVSQAADTVTGDNGQGATTGSLLGYLSVQRYDPNKSDKSTVNVPIKKAGIVSITLTDGNDKVLTGDQAAPWYSVSADGLLSIPKLQGAYKSVAIVYSDKSVAGSQIGNVIGNGTNNFNFTGNWKVPPNVYFASSNKNSPSLGSADGANNVANNAHDSNPTCQTGGFGLNWIICPVFNTVANFCDWMFEYLVQPFLRTSPISTDPNDPSYKIWSQFRILGNIFLIIALLVIVFGQSIGGGLVDAYTAKKVLPRLLAAAILINLSIYIVAFLVDITNIIGGGLGALLTAPLNGAGAFNINPSFVSAGKVVGATGIAAGLGLIAVGLAGIPSVSFIMLFLVMPAALALLAAFVTLILRKAIILALVLVSPVAFALYCLPNTEKYFRKWWDLLIKTLLVYPIVIGFFAIADILSVTIINANGSGSGLALLISFLLQFLPLVFIPYAFKIAGGIVGGVYSTLSGSSGKLQEAIKGNANDPNSARNRARYGTRSKINAGRERRVDAYSNLAKSADLGSRRGRLQKRFAMGAAAIAGSGNLQAERAKYNKEQDDIAAAQYSYGNDASVRALWAKKGSNGKYYSTYRGPEYNHGTFEEADAAGDYKGYKEVSPIDVAKAESLVGGDMSRFQAYAKYEMGKAAQDGQLEAFESRFIEMNNGAKYSTGEANGIWGGVKFSHQNARKERKYKSIIGTKGKLKFGRTDHAGLSNELVDTMRKGDFSGFRSSTGIEALRGFDEAQSRLSTPDFYSSDDNFEIDNNSGERKAIHNAQTDTVSRNNYAALGQHLASSFLPNGQVSPELLRQFQIEDGTDPTQSGFGLGASQRGEEAWKKFVKATTNTSP